MIQAPCGKLFDGGPEMLSGHAEDCEYCHAWQCGFMACKMETERAKSPEVGLHERYGLWYQALSTIAAWPITDMRRNLDAVNMARTAVNALAFTPDLTREHAPVSQSQTEPQSSEDK